MGKKCFSSRTNWFSTNKLERIMVAKRGTTVQRIFESFSSQIVVFTQLAKNGYLLIFNHLIKPKGWAFLAEY